MAFGGGERLAVAGGGERFFAGGGDQFAWNAGGDRPSERPASASIRRAAKAGAVLLLRHDMLSYDISPCISLLKAAECRCLICGKCRCGQVSLR